ncbi:hypothetical protein Arnit_1762 [Arcobacter nitrofigilis DSM 7299]|uniref:Uncharacterized protein n=1 Tax=Arcobacter nitrofigilis (strain ATCC 33309 / DSM 7299 / CCUG 15893 / LMG 7604 / NCTC 12251 / CI) TaxID=572480 RepID=D5V1I2_ARCNC|nr:hypothetical protein Arnit_1762 [Arcobacter nitrofigilis DSM 7299]
MLVKNNILKFLFIFLISFILEFIMLYLFGEDLFKIYITIFFGELSYERLERENQSMSFLIYFIPIMFIIVILSLHYLFKKFVKQK